MIFTSIEFAIFFPIVFVLYWAISGCCNVKLSNLFLIMSSYIFYGWWNWRACILLFGVTAVTWICGYGMYYYRNRYPDIEKKSKWKSPIFWINLFAIVFCIGILGVFKYFDFFIDSFSRLFTLLGRNLEISRLGLVLPLGISFYVFQSLTYTIDIYKRKMEPTNDIVAYFAFMSFFPQLLSGPIGRASRLIPQFLAKRVFDYDSSISGCRMILWGLFMKVCVADRLAIYVNTIYDNLAMHNGTSVALAAILYSFQIYGDFAGYSYMAIGTGRLLGIKLDENFHRPYFSDSISDFWRRWHISLSTWFRDYVYIPLGGNRVSIGRNYLNLFITFIASGLWHGAAWSFVFWGGLHGAYQILDKIRRKFTPKYGMNAAIIKVCGVVATFILVTFAWIFFRITDIGTAFTAISKIFTEFGHPFIDKTTLGFGVLSLMLLLFIEYIHESKLLDKVSTNRGGGIRCVRYIGALLLVLWIIAAGVFDGGQFIYFQF